MNIEPLAQPGNPSLHDFYQAHRYTNRVYDARKQVFIPISWHNRLILLYLPAHRHPTTDEDADRVYKATKYESEVLSGVQLSQGGEKQPFFRKV